MTSLWLDRKIDFPADEFAPGTTYDTVVAGAGLTGLVTALLLARSGQNVLVLEARHPAAVTTGNTTAKVTLLQDTVLSQLSRQYSQKVVNAYVEMNKEGQSWLLRYLDSNGLPYQRRTAYTYATTPEGAEKLRMEFAAATSAGLNVNYVRTAGLPFHITGAVSMDNQAQINPLDVIEALARDVKAHGGTIVGNARVTGAEGSGPVTVKTSLGEVRAKSLVLATGTPILDRGLYFAKLKPHRSYAAALELPGFLQAPEGMYLSVEQPTRSLRDYPVDGGGDGTGSGKPLLLVGGSGHPVGKAGSEQAHLDDLLGWAQSHFPGAKVTHTWSAQDYQAVNLMPFFGRLPRGRGDIYFATGYNKWGMTNAVGASLGIAADILDGQIPWADTLHRRVTAPPAAASAVGLNAGVGATLAKDWGKLLVKGTTADGAPEEGTGVVTRSGMRPVATSTVNGRTCRVSGKCTHLGGILHWNDAEKTWDCPLHGSRFTPEGENLEGPATMPLAKMPEPGKG
ncbi:FAD-dependent oxidoreductase [Pseudarthrobacter sp. J75]|uniref:FAD-dependent oxidoreductase n=1 Tax=unclassified Pseudarthrobacter TaxID=2647000 RepID=UPI002E81545A|nr:MULTISPECIES: FAD-dependent oxidoreductase [unclassified Pseudarthrobacter]MEE2522525.1 FAD-dependent oxidoreductase [Pseudarthrobacter sp. J47]MEE2529131.1 FAD-dependent oxidoreductase [Pseudarthrobacter sp. J75]